MLRRPYPAFKPHPLAYKQPACYFGNHMSFVPSGTPIRTPRLTKALDYELELGAVPCKPLLKAHVEINGQIVTTTSTANMLHDWASTLSYLSMDEPLWPGELIATGTLPFGSSLENGQWLKPGGTLRLSIEGVGEIRHALLA